MNHQQTDQPEEILVVDDTPANLQLLSQMLADQGVPSSSGDHW